MKLEEAVKEIKRKTDLVQVIGREVKLKKNGSSYLGICPFHSEKTPSFYVRPDRGYFKCFGCNAAGDVFEFLQKTTGQLFIDIVKRLAGDLNIKIDDTYKSKFDSEVVDSLSKMQITFRKQLRGEAFLYLTKHRRYPPDFIDKMELGFGGHSAGLFHNRITIPIKNHLGQLVAFGGRIFKDFDKNKPKYVNSASNHLYDKSRVLYGLYQSLALIRNQKRAVLVEGYFDVMALLAVGIPAIAPCGTSLSDKHVELLRKYTNRIVLCFDQDQAGFLAHEKALLLFLNQEFIVQTVALPAKDPDTLWQKGQYQILKQLFEQPKDAVESRIELALNQSIGGINERILALQGLLPILSASPDPLVNRQYVRLAAQIFKEDENLLVNAVSKFRPASLKRLAVEAPRPMATVIWTPAEKLLLKAIISAPEVMVNYEKILEDSGLNRQIIAIIQDLLNGRRLEDLNVPQIENGSEEDNVSKTEAEKIFSDWSEKVEREKRQSWLKEQHLKLMSLSNQGNLDGVRQTLQDQSIALKKGWA